MKLKLSSIFLIFGIFYFWMAENSIATACDDIKNDFATEWPRLVQELCTIGKNLGSKGCQKCDPKSAKDVITCMQTPLSDTKKTGISQICTLFLLKY